MERIRYFDAHCDTIYRCYMDAADVSLLFAEEKEFFSGCDTLLENSGHIDLVRAEQFCQYGQFFALFYDGAGIAGEEMWELCQKLHQRFVQEMAENEDRIIHCHTGRQVDEAIRNGRAAALLSIEGADLLNCDVRHLETAAQWGVRFINPVWNHANILSGTNCEEPDRGLSPQGIDFIRQMEDVEIYADVSHLSDAGFWDLYRKTRKPIVASHSNSRALCAHPRNLSDDMFRAIRDTGGVVGINLYQTFVGEDLSMDALVGHIEHFLALDGTKTVCIGGDMDGCEKLAAGMEGIQDIPKLYAALEAKGYDQALLEDIFWNNLRRIL